MTTKRDLYYILESVPDKNALINAMIKWFPTPDLIEFANYLQEKGIIENPFLDNQD